MATLRVGGEVKRISGLFFLLVMFGLVFGSMVWAEKPVLGWLEKAVILPDGFILDAKLDTGADNTSLDARDIKVIHRDGRNVLRFTVDDRQGKTYTLEREQVGIELVPQHVGDDTERPLIVLDICIGNECRNTLVNLVDRSKKKYGLLVGRSFMLDRVLIHSGRKYLTQPRAGSGKKQ